MNKWGIGNVSKRKRRETNANICVKTRLLTFNQTNMRLKIASRYQSYLTANTASRPAAARPASQAVAVPASTTAPHSAASRAQGTCRSMVQ